jgi:hypothetical protein
MGLGRAPMVNGASHSGNGVAGADFSRPARARCLGVSDCLLAGVAARLAHICGEDRGLQPPVINTASSSFEVDRFHVQNFDMERTRSADQSSQERGYSTRGHEDV